MSRILGVPYQSPLRYLPERTALIPVIRVSRLPTVDDKKYPICQMWIIGASPTTGTEGDLYYLERFDASGDAIWTKLADVSGISGLQQLTGDTGTAVIDASDNIDVVGNASQGVSTSGAATTLTVTVADATDTTKGVASYNATDFTVTAGNVVLGDTIVKQVSADAGDATPVSNVVTITGAGGITTSASGSTITITGSATVAGSFVTDAGTATPAANVINILGGTGVNTAGAGSTVTVNIDSPVTVANGGTGLTTITDGGILIGSGTGAITVTAQPTDGQVLIGSTGSDPVLSTLTDGTGISITEGAGTITIGLDGTVTVPNGGTGNTTFTPYTVICAGTTATGDFQNVASVGTANQVLTSNGAGALPTFQTIPSSVGSMVQIDSQTLAGGETYVVFTGIDSTYFSYIIYLSDILPTENKSDFVFQTSEDGGVTYSDTLSSYKDYVSFYLPYNYASVIAVNHGSANGKQGSGKIEIYDPSNANQITACDVKYVFRRDIESSYMTRRMFNTRYASTAVNAIRFFFINYGESVSTFASGTFKMYGILA